MELIIQKVTTSPVLIRVVPFVIFVGLTFLQGEFGEASRYWIYFLKTVVGAWFLWLMRPLVSEMKAKFSIEAIFAGIVVFGIWVGLNDLYPKFGQAGKPWNPYEQFGAGSALALFFITVRILGSALVVPFLEEVFYRSFLYRYIANPDFQSISLGSFIPKAFVITSVIFGVAHYEWLAGILCGFIFQGLVLWKRGLGEAIVAHGVANLLLGGWVVWKGAWQFW